jgi:hypothetical protein
MMDNSSGVTVISVGEQGNPRVWVHLRIGTPRKEAMIRCNVGTTQGDIEEVATE